MEEERPGHAGLPSLLFSLCFWGWRALGRNGCSRAAERPSPSSDPHRLRRRTRRRNDVKRNLTFPDMSVNEISGVGMEIQLCTSMAEGHRLDRTQTGRRSSWLRALSA